MKKINVIRLTKGNVHTPERFWNRCYIETKQEYYQLTVKKHEDPWHHSLWGYVKSNCSLYDSEEIIKQCNFVNDVSLLKD